MTWFGWVLIAVIALSTLINVSIIDKPREPITPGAAVVIVILNFALIWGVLTVGTGRYY